MMKTKRIFYDKAFDCVVSVKNFRYNKCVKRQWIFMTGLYITNMTKGCENIYFFCCSYSALYDYKFNGLLNE